jgi:hypothetical protein
LGSINSAFPVPDRWCFSLIPFILLWNLSDYEIFSGGMIVEDFGINETISIEYDQRLAIWIFMSV